MIPCIYNFHITNIKLLNNNYLIINKKYLINNIQGKFLLHNKNKIYAI